MVFKSTSGFSTYTNTPYLVGSCAIYTHRVSIIHAIIVHSDTRGEFSFFVIASGRSRSDFHFFQAKEEERKQLYVRSASSGLRFFYLSGRERKPFDGLILDRKIEAFLVSDAIAFCDLPTEVLGSFQGKRLALIDCVINRHSSHKFLKITENASSITAIGNFHIFEAYNRLFAFFVFTFPFPKHTNV